MRGIWGCLGFNCGTMGFFDGLWGQWGKLGLYEGSMRGI